MDKEPDYETIDDIAKSDVNLDPELLLKKNIFDIIEHEYNAIMRNRVIGAAQLVVGANEEEIERYILESKANYAEVLMLQLYTIKHTVFDDSQKQIYKKTKQHIAFEEFAHEYARQSIKQGAPLDTGKQKELIVKTREALIQKIGYEKQMKRIKKLAQNVFSSLVATKKTRQMQFENEARAVYGLRLRKIRS